MTFIMVAIGVLVVAGTLVDVAWTTMAAGSGAGPLTSRLARRSWQLAMSVYGRTGRHAVLTIGGVAIVFVVLAAWILLVLVGWSLVFTASDGAVRGSSTGMPADLVDRLYFTGYTVFTLGNGEFRPGAGTWQLATVLATGTGLMLVTLSITYLVPVASAVAQRRQLASVIASLGSTPHEILVRFWTGQGFGMLDQHLASLGNLIQKARQQHYTYPVLHYFHSTHHDSAAPPNIANLSDALLMAKHGVDPEARPDAGTLDAVDATIHSFLDTLGAAYIDQSHEPLSPPSLRPLVAAGIPVVAELEFGAAVSRDRESRRLLAGLLHDDGWPARDR